jgi:predicted short-subunit dehydrogenase-like oxidoreductase (DUF2520 family)
VKIILIGAGNVATRIAIALKQKNVTPLQVYSRTRETAEKLANLIGSTPTDNLQEILPSADLYLFAVTDNALVEVINALPPNQGLWVHTSGCLSIDIFRQTGVARYGVLYPLQTFSKERLAAIDRVPMLVEANNPTDGRRIIRVARKLSPTVAVLPSEERKYLHLAAVFASNFVNHLYSIAEDILNDHGIDPTLLQPLMEETAFKIRDLRPRRAQTGPAIRGDSFTMEKHLSLLADSPHRQKFYQLFSESIAGAY